MYDFVKIKINGLNEDCQLSRRKKDKLKVYYPIIYFLPYFFLSAFYYFFFFLEIIISNSLIN